MKDPTEICINSKYPLYKQLKWVMTARSKTDPKLFCRMLQVKGRMIACTDGHRIHSLQVPEDVPFPNGLEDGAWEVVKNYRNTVYLRKDTVSRPMPDRGWGLLVPGNNHTCFETYFERVWRGDSTDLVDRYIAIVAWDAIIKINETGRLNKHIMNPFHIMKAMEGIADGSIRQVWVAKDQVIFIGKHTRACVSAIRRPSI